MQHEIKGDFTDVDVSKRNIAQVESQWGCMDASTINGTLQLVF